MKSLKILIGAFVLVFGAVSTLAQSVRLSGKVLDGSGEPLKNTDVTITTKDHRLLTEVKSSEDGKFAFVAASGSYGVAVSALGFTDFGPVSANFISGVESEVVIPAGVIDRIEIPPRGINVGTNLTWDYGALVQGGVGLQDRSDFGFAMIGAHLGKVLTPELGTGLFKGNFEYAVEVFPFWQSYTPTISRITCPVGATNAAQCSAPYSVGGTYTGASVTPIILRWNLTHGERLMPWVQGAGGVVWTDHKYPAVGNLNPLDPTQTGPAADTSVWNFTPQFGVGAHYFVAGRRSVDFAVNAVHISSASLGDKNPGVNTSVQFSIGYSWWK